MTEEEKQKQAEHLSAPNAPAVLINGFSSIHLGVGGLRIVMFENLPARNVRYFNSRRLFLA